MYPIPRWQRLRLLCVFRSSRIRKRYSFIRQHPSKNIHNWASMDRWWWQTGHRLDALTAKMWSWNYWHAVVFVHAQCQAARACQMVWRAQTCKLQTCSNRKLQEDPENHFEVGESDDEWECGDSGRVAQIVNNVLKSHASCLFICGIPYLLPDMFVYFNKSNL